MRRAGAKRPFGASIINISSIAGLRGISLSSGYCATKGAVHLFTKSTAIEFAALRYNIRVNSVHPGVVQTPMIDQIMERYVELGVSPDSASAKKSMRPPLRRLADPIDIAKTVRFLASDEAGYMTGAELVVDGGLTAK
jgi:NAD(P)-dependent dehydrogenase (short-subunit alcohol dehydrogenase family)